MQPGTRPPHLESQKQQAALARTEAPPPGPNTRPAHPQREPVPLAPPLSSWSSARQPAASGHLPGLRDTQRDPRYRVLPPPPGPWGRGPNLRSPHPEEEEEEEGRAGFPPGSSLSPQPPWTATAAGNAASSHLRGSTRKHTLHAKQALLPSSPEFNSSRETEGKVGKGWEVELPTGKGT